MAAFHSGFRREELTAPNRIGIVTRVDLITHPLIKTQYTINLYSQEDYVNVINATVQMQEAMEKDRKIGLFTNFNHGFIAVGHLYADWPAEQLDVFKSFDNLTSLISTAVPTSKGTIGSLAKAMAHGLESKKCASHHHPSQPSRQWCHCLTLMQQAIHPFGNHEGFSGPLYRRLQGMARGEQRCPGQCPFSLHHPACRNGRRSGRRRPWREHIRTGESPTML